MFEKVLAYGREIKNNRYTPLPVDLIEEIYEGSVGVVRLKVEIYNNASPIEPCDSLDRAYDKVCSSENEMDIVMYTLMFIAYRNPLVYYEITKGILNGYC